jgi:FkbM family methyltransferase
MIIIDLGGCKGDFVKPYIDDSNNTIYIFEPFPHNADIIQRDFGNRVHLIRNLVGSKNGTVDFYLTFAEQGVYFRPSILNDKPDVYTDSISLSMVKLSDWWKQNLSCDVDLLKVDIEGAEYDVFEDLLDTGIINRFKKIIFEEHAFHREKDGKRIGIASIQDKARIIIPRLLKEYHGILKYGGPPFADEQDVPAYLLNLLV